MGRRSTDDIGTSVSGERASSLVFGYLRLSTARPENVDRRNIKWETTRPPTSRSREPRAMETAFDSRYVLDYVHSIPKQREESHVPLYPICRITAFARAYFSVRTWRFKFVPDTIETRDSRAYLGPAARNFHSLLRLLGHLVFFFVLGRVKFVRREDLDNVNGP